MRTDLQRPRPLGRRGLMYRVLWLVLFLAAWGSGFSGHSQNITLAEYFFDVDPGFGLATPFALASPSANLTLTAAVPLSSLSAGFHQLGIRARDANGEWSLTSRRVFYFEPSAGTTPVAITKAEYTIDTEADYGAGTDIPIASPAADLAGLTFTVNNSALAPGFHRISIRTRDANGEWSLTSSRPFYYEPNAGATAAQLTKLEYFLDADPGYGNGVDVPVTASANLSSLAVLAPLTSLSEGFHTLQIRSRDANGGWSLTSTRTFYYEPGAAVASNINRIEYYFDTDPGFGSGINAPIATPANNLPSFSFVGDATALPDGAHRIFVRARDANGKWSLVGSKTFVKSGCASSANLAAGLASANYTGSSVTNSPDLAFNTDPASPTTSNSPYVNTGGYLQVDFGVTQNVSEVRAKFTPAASGSFTLQVQTAAAVAGPYTTVDTYTATLSTGTTYPVARVLATPATNVRAMRLVVQNPGGSYVVVSGAMVYNFNCSGPGLTSIAPTSGAIGSTVVLNGSNLQGVTTVTFAGASGNTVTTGFAVNGAGTQLTGVMVPSGATTGSVTVTSPNGTSNGVSFVVLAPPAVAGFAPAAGAVGASVAVTGTNFTGITSLTLGGVAVTTYSVTSPTDLTFSVPVGAVSGPIAIANASGTGTSATSFVVIPAPVVSSFAPGSGPVGTVVVLTGTGFANASSVRVNGVAATFAVNSSTSITTTVPAGASTGLIAVTTPGGTSSSAAAFTVIPPPILTSFTPTSGSVGTVVTISGSNFQNTSTVVFNGTAAPGFVVNGAATEVSVAVPGGASSGPISLTTPGGTTVSSSSFIVLAPPTITSFTPGNGPVGTSVTVTGTNLLGCTSVLFNGSPASFSGVTNASLVATVPAGATTGLITITAPGGTASSASSFVVNQPAAVNSFAPASGPAGTSVIITGSDFTGVTSVTFNGIAAASFILNTSTQLTAVVPAGAGTGVVAVTTNIGAGSSGSSFTFVPTTLATQPLVCLNAGTISLNGGAPSGGTYSGTGVANGQFAPTAAGTSTITYTLALNGVTTTASQPLTVLPLPVLTASDTLLCAGASANLSVVQAGPGATYAWSTGASGASISASPGARTAYSVVVTNAAGCSYTLRQVLSVRPGTAPASFALATPAANAVDVDPISGTLSWDPATDATSYDVYVWPSSVPTRPNLPAYVATAGINVTLTPAIVGYATAYHWQVVARNSCFSQSSAVHSFTTMVLPDLRVTALTAPANGLINQPISVSWTVQNTGANGTGATQWNDYVYLSVDHDVDIRDILIGTFPNQRALQPGQSYTQLQNIALPRVAAVGSYHLYVLSNLRTAQCKSFYNNTDSCTTARYYGFPPTVRETTYQNNWKHQLLALTYPPVPDLVVNSVGIPAIAFAGSTLGVTYRLKNRGMTAARGDLSKVGTLSCWGNYWRNAFYISRDTLLDTQVDVRLGDDDFHPTKLKAGLGALSAGCDPRLASYSDALAVDSSLVAHANVPLPHNLTSGTYYVLAVADAGDNVFEGPAKNNNVRSSAALQVTMTPPPDLVVTQVSIPATAGVGKALAMSWTVENQGAKAPDISETTWYDNVYISRLPTFQLDSAQLVGSIANRSGSAFAPGNSYVVNQSLLLPRGTSGSFYVYVWTDAQRQVFEYTGDNNNITRSTGRVTLNYTTYPDLVVTQILVPDTVQVNQPFTVQWTIRNQGQDAVNAIFEDEMRVSTDTTLAISGTTVGSTRALAVLAPGQSFTKSSSVVLNSGAGWDNQRVHFFLRADSKDEIYEYGGENNNLRSTFDLGRRPVFVRGSASFDLQVSALTALATANSGTLLAVSATVRNGGAIGVGSAAAWGDDLVLSADTLLDPGDKILNHFNRMGPVAAGASYSQSIQALLPDGLSGTYYLLYSSSLSDAQPGNNVRVVPLTIQLSPPADLVISSFTVADTLFAGQTMRVPFQLANTGVGPALPTKNPWFTGAYLNATPMPGLQVGSQPRSGPLAAGTSATDSVLVTIPRTYLGNYYLVLKADNSNSVYEHNAEGNNTRARLVYIKAPPQTDLVMTALSVPASAVLGSSASMTYTVRNAGTHATLGPLTNNLYWSAERAVAQASEKLFETDLISTVLAPGQQMTRTVTARPQTLRPNYYHGIALANARQTTPEINFANNRLVSADSTNWQVTALVLGVPATNIALASEEQVYYQLACGTNQDVLLTLTSQSAAAANEVYVAYERIPTSSDYDFKYQSVQAANQEVLIPGTRAGRYFIYLRTASAGVMGQGATLLAQVLPYSIRSITPAVVGQGVVSTTLSGAGFRTPTIVRLRNGVGAVVTTAQLLSQTSSMQLQLRWSLAAVPVGAYTVETQNPDGSIQQLVNGLRVVAATPLSVDYLPNSPSVMRRGGIAGVFVFTFRNTSNVDIPVMHGQFSTIQAAQISDVRGNAGNPMFGSAWGAGRELGAPSHDWYKPGDGLVYVPFIARNVRPGAEVTVQFSTNIINVGAPRLTVQPSVYLYHTVDLLGRLTAQIETLRESMIADPVFMHVDTEPSVLALLPNRKAFIDTMLTRVFDIGLLAPADTVGFNFLCDSCLGLSPAVASAGTYTFSPGSGTRVDTLNRASAVFGPAGSYLWHINKYAGTAGHNPGWDLMQMSGPLTVQATATQPFVIHLASLSYQNTPALLAGWYPAVDASWPILIASGGISGFASNKFSLNTTQFTAHNNLYGGTFSLRQAGDTLKLVFTAFRPGVGVAGVPGAPGAPGEAGSPGGPGGPGNGSILPGKGGKGGPGGPSVSGAVTWPAGAGGPGGPGGPAGPNQAGGPGADGGSGGVGAPTGPGGGLAVGGPGGPGGPGAPGWPGLPAGPGGTGGPGGPGSLSGPGGPGGTGSPAGPRGKVSPLTGSGLPVSCGTGGGPVSQSECEGALDLMNASRATLQAAKQGELSHDLVTTGIRLLAPDEDANCTLNALVIAAADAADVLKLFATGNNRLFAEKDAVISSLQLGLRLGNCVNRVYQPENVTMIKSWVDGLDCVKGGDMLDVSYSLRNCAAKSMLCVPIRNPCDPNEIEGPAGYGPPQYVAATATLPYKVTFENDKVLATASAQRINVRVPLDENVNPLSVRLGDLGFHNQLFHIPSGLAAYHTVLPLTDSLGVDVEVTAGVDVGRREVFWEMQSIDRGTGLAPANPLAGFLPANDSTHAGEGFVMYTVKPRANAATGDSIRARASIQFDVNDGITTNLALNIVDAVAPTSRVQPILAAADSVHQIRISALDDTGGSGLRSFDVYMSLDGNAYQPYLTGLTTSPASFTARPGHRYYFYALATDNVGNTEAPKASYEAQWPTTPLPVELIAFTAVRRGQQAHLAWTTASERNCAGFEVEVSVDGRAFQRIGWVPGHGSSTQANSYSLDDADLTQRNAQVVYYRLREQDTDGTGSFSPVRTVAVPAELLVKTVLSVWPNPAHGSLSVTGVAPGELVQVFDALGRVIVAVPMPASHTLQLQLPATTATGLYLVRAGKQTCRLINE
ncbi:hypothetical protein KB206_20675 [Microvirga sp. STS02]|uniref:CARDB domain-containing protein n=1 Tax=Hymenobacter negativus TaxID=2795026 RepID=UPI0018DB0221|nr:MULTISPECIES: CARDB domain-containing protein [Bacteria]MBH8571319.1 hypothetical protein [Hymenobacter negativus]MBR7211057.1 hypothetical protein [Microvirga sp. STS02]